MKKGKLIVFEGGEGSGKTTISGMVYEYFRDNHIPVIKSREPGGVEVSEKIREVILNNEMDVITELLLYEAARREHYLKVIKPALDEGKVVILDRFTDSTIAIQGYARGCNLCLINILNEVTTDELGIDLCIIFNIDPEVAQKRIKENNRETNRFDNYDIEFHNKVNLGLKDISYEDNHVMIDVNTKTIDEVFKETIEVIKDARLI